MFSIKSSFVLFFIAFYIELSVFEDVLTSASASHKSEIDEELQMIKAVQESMLQWKIRSSKHRKKRQTNVVCYGELGCFEDSGPFGYIDMLPQSPEEIDTQFYVFSTKNRSDNPFLQFSFHDISPYSLLNETITTTTQSSSSNQRMDRNAKLTNVTTFDPTKVYNKFGDLKNSSMRVIVHGFGSSCPHEWVDEMRAALMAVEECFVMCVDWEKGAVLPNYVRAAANTRLVGKQLAFLLKGLNKHNGLEFEKVHIIGFSLGAHASGFAGAELKKLHRITGLDPAGPLFEGAHVAARLDESDAEFVDVIHSNGENLILGGLGSWQPMGHVDFYPNGGRVQTGCSNLFVGAVTDIIWTSPAKAEGRSLCNHRRAYKFFIDSVAPRCLFPAFPCNSYEDFLLGKCFHCPNRKAKSIRSSNTTSQEIKFHEKIDSICGAMGYYADKSTGRGQLYLRTREEEPYCAHQYSIKIHSSPQHDLPIRTLGRIDVELESEGGLTEAFTITDRDDQELFTGDIISKIIVPHPALNFPKNLTIVYQVYRGWLTRGLSAWSINKVILSDSFGESYSLCKRLKLESGKAHRMTLQSGDCHEEELNLLAEKATREALAKLQATTTSPQSSTEIYETFNITNVIELGKHIPLERNETESVVTSTATSTTTEKVLTTTSSAAWKPILSSGSTSSTPDDDNITMPASSSNSSNFDEEKFLNLGERMPKKAKTEKRSFGESGEDDLVNTVPIRDDSSDMEEPELDDDAMTDESVEDKFVTVQLFQYRLGDVFEKAEKYARFTLFPLLSEQISNIFNFDQSEKDLMSSTDSPIIMKSMTKNLRKYDQEEFDVRSLQTMGLKIDDHIKPIEKLFKNYAARISQQENESKESIRIDLPTYRPELQSAEKVFIPIERHP